jgi:glycosyltransferase involved in cell wall biosynthesis
MVTRLIRSKGVLEFARSASIVQASSPGVRFLLVGAEDSGSVEGLTGGELDEVKARVRWIGHRQDVAVILAASDIFALPSFYGEGIPRALIEASAMGLPLVSCPNPGSSEVIRDGFNGFLVRPGDPEDLANAILRLAGQRDLRRTMGERACQVAAERFDLSVVARKTREVYRSLMGAPEPSRWVTDDATTLG